MSLPKHILTAKERKIFQSLNTPRKIQDFLEIIPVNFERMGETCMSPRRLLKNRVAHCMEGALFAAAALWYHGQRPLVLDLRATEKDDDHVVAVFRQNGHWGAISKTNHAVLRYREPVYRTVRELVLSYFHEYFLNDGRKTLREYSQLFDLSRFGFTWVTASEDLWHIPETLDDSPHQRIISRSMATRLRRADRIEIKAGKLTQWKK